MGTTKEIDLIHRFSRTQRLVEKMFPGAQAPADQVETTITPVYEFFEQRVGEIQFRCAVSSAAAVAGDNEFNLEEPTPGRIHRPLAITLYQNDTVAGVTADIAIVSTGNASDVWGLWVPAALSPRGLATVGGIGAFFTLGMVLPEMMRGNQFRVTMRGMTGGIGSVVVNYWFYDSPGELVKLGQTTPLGTFG